MVCTPYRVIVRNTKETKYSSKETSNSLINCVCAIHQHISMRRSWSQNSNGNISPIPKPSHCSQMTLESLKRTATVSSSTFTLSHLVSSTQLTFFVGPSHFIHSCRIHHWPSVWHITCATDAFEISSHLKCMVWMLNSQKYTIQYKYHRCTIMAHTGNSFPISGSTSSVFVHKYTNVSTSFNNGTKRILTFSGWTGKSTSSMRKW